MSENSDNNKNVSNDEIDLLDLFRSMGKTLTRWARAIGRAFLISVVFLFKRWLPLGLSIAAGIGVTFILKNTSEAIYTSDMVFRNNLALMESFKLRDKSGTTAEIISKINKLQILCSNKNSIALAHAFASKPDSVENIFDINAYWIIDNGKDGIPDYVDYKNAHSASDTTNIRMQDRFDVRVQINASQDLNLVRNGIKKFIQDDSLFQQRNRLRLRQNRALLTRLNNDILQLDSLQKVKYFEETRNIRPSNGGQMIFLQEQKTQLVYTDIYTLFAKKQTIETELNLYSGILTVVNDFSLPGTRLNGTNYYAKKIIPLFFGFTLLVLILLANRKKIKETFKKY